MLTLTDQSHVSLSHWLRCLLYACMQSNGHHISMGGDLYQERLSRLEGDKESLVLQVLYSRPQPVIASSYPTQAALMAH
jgi:hypothetical protein